MFRIYNFYVGLSQANYSESINHNQVASAATRRIDSFSIYDPQDLFIGFNSCLDSETKRGVL